MLILMPYSATSAKWRSTSRKRLMSPAQTQPPRLYQRPLPHSNRHRRPIRIPVVYPRHRPCQIWGKWTVWRTIFPHRHPWMGKPGCPHRQRTSLHLQRKMQQLRCHPTPTLTPTPGALDSPMTPTTPTPRHTAPVPAPLAPPQRSVFHTQPTTHLDFSAANGSVRAPDVSVTSPTSPSPSPMASYAAFGLPPVSFYCFFCCWSYTHYTFVINEVHEHVNVHLCGLNLNKIYCKIRHLFFFACWKFPVMKYLNYSRHYN